MPSKRDHPHNPGKRGPDTEPRRPFAYDDGWLLYSYSMVFGPSLSTYWGGLDTEGGWLFFNIGAMDFAGATVVHINASIAALIGALMIGKRVGFGKDN